MNTDAPYTKDEWQRFIDKVADPVWFAENILGEKVWSKQAEMLRSCAKYPRVAVRSGHKTSKTRSMAILALWWPFYWYIQGEDARVAISSASFDQVKKALWREIRGLVRKSKAYQEVLEKDPSLDPSTGLTLKNGNQTFGFSTTEPERAAGVSSPHILYLLDEASGIEDNIFEAMEGNMAGGAKIFIASQGTKTTGEFYKAFTKYSKQWHCIRLSSYDSPNVTGEMKIPGLAVKEWIEEKLDMWGSDSIAFKVRVLGEFPGEGENTVVSRDVVDSALERWEDTAAIGTLSLGVDVARFGDDESIIYAVRGQHAHKPITMRNRDGNYVARAIIEAVRKHRKGSDKRVEVRIDEVGLGSSPVDALRNLDATKELGIVVMPLHVQSAASDVDNYHNLGSEMAFQLADWLKGGGAIPDDPNLVEELVSNTYDLDAKGRRRVASKKDIKKLIKRSPDRRNALEMAIYKKTSGLMTRGTAHIDL